MYYRSRVSVVNDRHMRARLHKARAGTAGVDSSPSTHHTDATPGQQATETILGLSRAGISEGNIENNRMIKKGRPARPEGAKPLERTSVREEIDRW